ncbi:Cof-type HAD-IIB family hydrolase [Streptococcus saliviloxodontae]|uniref:Cof subfamily protein (Haloacid dehalogenase superfamily) n=1 Tax=Streptococcus saliviloxodontae TaxID=1349416 RepID=A0ABS2PM86_9STRE|nr:Cof-type HAD-IIB family hydrolase [Streptococcus saliviloxodontae]MBM7636387.1 Cof subfamily protein (haloacid dehalogenase superfamily) [Streptococcus saliviloxodontae]
MADIKVLALDMDGTLFNSQKEVTPENRQALAAARDLGVKVVITTGRPLKAIQHILEDLGLYNEDNYSITFNGGLVQRNNGDILAKTELSFKQVEAIYQAMEPLGLPVDVISDGVVYSLESQGNHSDYHKANPMLTFVEIDSLADLPRDIVYNKIVIVTDASFLDQQIPKIPANLYEQFELFKSRDIILEIMPKGVHKAVGLDLLTKHLGMTAANVMAMGDEENDLSMLEWAGWGVAMANGAAIAKTTANAVTTKTNDESGVAEAVHQYILDK